MEVAPSMCFIVLSTLLTLWFLKISLCGSNRKHKKQLLPPGPWALPILGSLHHVISSLPHRRMAELSRRHGPLMLLWLGEVPTVVVSSAEVAAIMMKTNDSAFLNRSSSAMLDIFGCGGKGLVLAPYGDRWRQMRKVCIIELLSSKQVKRMEGLRTEEVGNLLCYLTATASTATGATINISEKVTALSNDVVSRAVFGAKFTHQKEYLHEWDKALALLNDFCLTDLFPSSRLARWLSSGERHMKSCCGRIQQILADVIEGRKAARAAGDGTCSTDEEGLLDALLRLHQEDSLEFSLTTETIGAVLFDIFAGATETTGSVLAWVMSELVRSPDIMSKAQKEVREVLGEDQAVITNINTTKLHYMQMVIKEVLRLHPPAPLVLRAAGKDCTIMGYDIPKGTNVYINIFAISQDPRYWKDPDEFRPDRFESNNVSYNGTCYEYIPFGTGRRRCPGAQFSMSLTEMALANLLYHFDWMLPDGDGASITSFDMSEKSGFAVSRMYDLQLRAIPHVWSKAMSSK